MKTLDADNAEFIFEEFRKLTLLSDNGNTFQICVGLWWATDIELGRF